MAKTSANDKITLGFIGLGKQHQHLVNCFNRDDTRIVAGCDVYDEKRDRFKNNVTEIYTKRGEKNVKVDMYEDYQELLARKDIDAVVIATPDHQHAIIGVAACKAGKDIYIEKPLTFTIYEGQMLCKAVRKYNRILQVGSMQRSWKEFLHFANIVREGELGDIHFVQTYVGRVISDTAAPAPMTLPKQEVPAGLNWDKWLGPRPTSIYYHSDIAPSLAEEGKMWPCWRYYQGYGGGMMTDWGAHMFDIAQWALGKDLMGPVEVIPSGYGYTKELTFKYDNGITLTEGLYPSKNQGNQGVKIYGDEGWIEVQRGFFDTNNPKFKMKDNEKFEEVEIGHYGMFLNSMRSRIDPNVPVEIGHSSCTMCNVANIAMSLQRPLKWNPIVQKFMHDDEANSRKHYEYREGYSLDV